MELLDPAEALRWFERFSFEKIPPYFLTHWKTGKSFFCAYGGLIAFEEARAGIVMAGEPLVRKGFSEQKTTQAFIDFAKSKNKKICGYYVDKKWRGNSFSKIPIGTSSSISLIDFNLKAPEAKEVRRALRKGRRLDYKIISVSKEERFGEKRIEPLFKKWKKAKLPLQIKFLISKPQWKSLISGYEEWFIVEKKGEALAFCSLLPYSREDLSMYYIDQLIHDPAKEPYALSYLVSYLIEELQSQGVTELDLGLNPFAKSEGRNLVEFLFRIFYKFPFWYRPKGLHFFKTKFSGYEKKEYYFFQDQMSPWLALKAMAEVTLFKD